MKFQKDYDKAIKLTEDIGAYVMGNIKKFKIGFRFQVSGFKKRSGLGMVEIIVVIALITTGFIAVLQLAFLERKTQILAKETTVAYFLVKEGFEAVRSIRDEDWTTNIASLIFATPYYPVLDNGVWELTDTDPGPVGSVTFSDDFNRVDSSTLGNGWVEVSNPPSDDAEILNNQLQFDTDDNSNIPIIQRDFTRQESGNVTLTFLFDWVRSGSEQFYDVWIQLGDSNLMVSPDTSDNTGVAANTKWASPNHGMTNQQGFGYVNGSSVTEVEVVSGPTTISIIANLNSNTFDLDIDPSDGMVEAQAIAFDNNVDIDTLRIYTNLVNDNNFSSREFDDIVVSGGDSIYRRWCEFSEVFRDGNDDIAVSGTSDADTRLITCYVSWTTAGGDTKQLRLQGYLTNWQAYQ